MPFATVLCNSYLWVKCDNPSFCVVIDCWWSPFIHRVLWYMLMVKWFKNKPDLVRPELTLQNAPYGTSREQRTFLNSVFSFLYLKPFARLRCGVITFQPLSTSANFLLKPHTSVMAWTESVLSNTPPTMGLKEKFYTPHCVVLALCFLIHEKMDLISISIQQRKLEEKICGIHLFYLVLDAIYGLVAGWLYWWYDIY